MSEIKILPEILSNKIAAGEVVERPSSVVKELVENALDADSSRIVIEVKSGGRSLIRVSDNGNGMSRDDAILSIERYATSKIYYDMDLLAIDSLGFRGEAIPSIASVSRFFLVTRDKKNQSGTEVFIEGGKLKKVSETGSPAGTMVTVRDLFFNMPARRKFLKTVNTEMSHIADTVASVALSRPDVRFKLLHNGKVVKNWPLVTSPVERATDVLGKTLRDKLNKIGFEKNGVSVSGWVASPDIWRNTGRGIFIYVNGRYVHNATVKHALFKGFRGTLMKGQFPVAVIYLKLPFDKVDVNVHPAKHEVRFTEQDIVHETVAVAVEKAVKLSQESRWGQKNPINTEKPVSSEPFIDYIKEPETIFRSKTEYDRTFPADSQEEMPWTITDRKIEQAVIWNKKKFSDLKIIGQFHNTYIICESAEGLIIIDQHAAHERIIFEKLRNISKNKLKASQKLLIPETIDLGHKEADILIRLIPELEKAGMEIEPFGGTTFAVRAVPVLFAGKQIQPVIMAMVEDIAETGANRDVDELFEKCLILMACHGAIRANQHLAHWEIRALFMQLDECENPSQCPHGRPTWKKWPLRFLEKSFGRII